MFSSPLRTQAIGWSGRPVQCPGFSPTRACPFSRLRRRRLPGKCHFLPRTALWDGAELAFSPVVPGVRAARRLHPALSTWMRCDSPFQAAYLIRLKNHPKRCFFFMEFRLCNSGLGRLPTGYKSPAFKAQSPRTARGQIEVVGHQYGGEPVGCVQPFHAGRRPGRRWFRPDRRWVRRPAAAGDCRPSARASATRCCSPPESSPGRWSPRSSRPTSLSQFAATASASRFGCAAGQQRHGHVFKRRKLRQQVMKLPNVTNLAIAKGGRLPRE